MNRINTRRFVRVKNLRLGPLAASFLYHDTIFQIHLLLINSLHFIQIDPTSWYALYAY